MAPDFLKRKRDAGEPEASDGVAAPAQLPEQRPKGADLGKMRRRLRKQKQVRETLLLDLGALVFELHRHGRREPELLQAKAAELTVVDEEVRTLAGALDESYSMLDLISTGIAGACENCGTIFTVDAHYCANCGAPAVPVLTAEQGSTGTSGIATAENGAPRELTTEEFDAVDGAVTDAQEVHDDGEHESPAVSVPPVGEVHEPAPEAFAEQEHVEEPPEVDHFAEAEDAPEPGPQLDTESEAEAIAKLYPVEERDSAVVRISLTDRPAVSPPPSEPEPTSPPQEPVEPEPGAAEPEGEPSGPEPEPAPEAVEEPEPEPELPPEPEPETPEAAVEPVPEHEVPAEPANEADEPAAEAEPEPIEEPEPEAPAAEGEPGRVPAVPWLDDGPVAAEPEPSEPEPAEPEPPPDTAVQPVADAAPPPTDPETPPPSEPETPPAPEPTPIPPSELPKFQPTPSAGTPASREPILRDDDDALNQAARAIRLGVERGLRWVDRQRKPGD